MSESVPARALGKAPLRWPSRADQVTAELREAILSGAYPPGTRLPPERELAERLRVGRSTIREALQRLQHLEMLRIRHGEGVTVLPLTEANIAALPHLIFRAGHVDVELLGQLFAAQEMLICAATQLAAQNGSDEDRSRALGLLDQMLDPTLDHCAYVEICVELIQLVTLASRNLVLHLVRKALWNQDLYGSEPASAALRPPHAALAPIVKDLQAATRNRDGAAAEDAVRQLLRAHAKVLLAGVRRSDHADP